MKEFIQSRGLRQFIKFGIVGISSTVIDWGIFYLLNYFFGVFYLVAKTISFAVSVINSYIWNRRWTFRSQDPNRNKEFIKFLLIALLGLLINTSIMYYFVSMLGARKIIGLLFATAITVIWNFLANKFYTFKESQL